MSQTDVNGPASEGDGAAAAGMGAGMLIMLVIGLVILLVIFWVLLKPLFFGVPNVAVHAQSLVETFLQAV